MADAYSERLFSYGTLQAEAVQLANFGRRVQGSLTELGGSITIVGLSEG